MRKLAVTVLASMLMASGSSAVGTISRLQESHVHEHEANAATDEFTLEGISGSRVRSLNSYHCRCINTHALVPDFKTTMMRS